ncbi:bifunctional metallophosphatase/5'-nucleotidase [Paenactinomyces guangxiensis]|uniref:5'-nucleotidase C-terminal domain-containing protein n=1 Tax=Paenactinomyces guangxiensis TaxID=1490290 RepID=A0A7W2A8K1_9BACL|nr:5'-nucleotidase C-terminal domain-containing protein [Paenactinomyces guangxiensis]MBA4494720.1 5'-nucleotidase C-terminal domain-containing protein [Paenactinomyces guangxiensis]MBH8591804.1 5'-nucleotidase C-terminal domain-containing protein [Paenactinomyces guangxiensis]
MSTKRNFWLPFLSVLLSIALVAGYPFFRAEAKEKKTAHLTIMSTSDLHGFITPINYTDNSPANHGLAKIATLVKQVRKQNPEALLFDSGDTIQGSPMEYYHARIDNKPIDPMMLAMNFLQYDAMAIGNHEYNYGRQVMEKAKAEANFPWLSANTLKKGTDDVYTKPYKIIKMKNGLRVGVLGLTTQKVPNWEDPKNIAHLDFIDVVKAAKKWVPIMKKKEKADVIFVSYHGGLEHKQEADGTITPLPQTDGENQVYQLATQVKGIDVILAGHMHTPLADVRVNGVLITEPNKWGSHLSVVDMELQKQRGRWIVTDKKAKLLDASTVEADPQILKLTRWYEEQTQAFLDKPVGKINGDMTVTDPHYTRTHDTALIEFINKVQMETSGADISAASLFNNDVPGLPEDVTTRDILSTYVYTNTLKVIRVKGSDIKASLEQTATYFKQNNGSEPVEVNPKFIIPKVQHYNYDMWEGIKYTIDVSKPEGQRIVELTDLNGQPLDMNKEYDVALNNYRAGGGGGYPMFSGKPVVKDINIEVSELITNYIREKGSVNAEVDNNWKIIGGIVD